MTCISVDYSRTVWRLAFDIDRSILDPDAGEPSLHIRAKTPWSRSQTMCMHTSMSNESSQYRGRLKPVDCLKKGHDKLNVI
jgi:hypothetical protein